MSFYYAEGLTVESPAQAERRLRALRQREPAAEPPFRYAPPERLSPAVVVARDVFGAVLYAVAVLAAGPLVVWATVALYARFA